MLKLYKNGYKITSPFGIRTLNGKLDNHKGIDTVGLNGDRQILSPVSGKVVSSTIVTDKQNATWEWGNYVRIDDVNGHRHFFCHMDKRNIKAGETVSVGDVIGIQGQTGLSFGEHLHYEIRTPGNISIDPQEFWQNKKQAEKEAEKKIYNTLEECPAWAQPTIKKLLDKSALNGTGAGLNLSEDMLRMFVINDRMGLYK